jgi:1,5-anhydro-D-fructose reductase (1,5-anhydro-D-mannitol-forming)
MTQRSVGEVVLRTQKGEERLPLTHVNLYLHALQAFHAAARGQGRPAASGEDGVRSMALALAAAESARTGRTVRVDPGL